MKLTDKKCIKEKETINERERERERRHKELGIYCHYHFESSNKWKFCLIDKKLFPLFNKFINWNKSKI
jgi:hypothetical protein